MEKIVPRPTCREDGGYEATSADADLSQPGVDDVTSADADLPQPGADEATSAEADLPMDTQLYKDTRRRLRTFRFRWYNQWAKYWQITDVMGFGA